MPQVQNDFSQGIKYCVKCNECDLNIRNLSQTQANQAAHQHNASTFGHLARVIAQNDSDIEK